MKKVLFTASVVKTHIMQFHLPCLQLLQKAGYRTFVAAKNDYEDPSDCRIPFCDRYIDLPFCRSPLGKGNLRACRELKKLIDRENFDIIHCHTPVAALLTRFAARKARSKGTKVIYTAHGFHFFKGSPLRSWLLYYPAEWLASRLTDVLVVINREDEALALRRMKAKKTLRVPGVGVDVSKFRPGLLSAEQRNDLRASFGVQPDEKLLLSVGELTKNKNHIQLLRVLAKEPLRSLRWKYMICGGGAQRKALQDEAESLGIADRVIFAGYRRDLPQLYNAADLFVFPSLREGLPVALMEAMACGLPAAASDIRGCRDLLPSECLFPLRDAAISESIAAGLSGKLQPQPLAECFSKDAVLGRMKEIYGLADFGQQPCDGNLSADEKQQSCGENPSADENRNSVMKRGRTGQAPPACDRTGTET